MPHPNESEHGDVPMPKRLVDLPRVGSRFTDERIDRLREAGREVLNISAYPQRDLPEEIAQSVRESMFSQDHAPANGIPGLRAAIAEYWEERNCRPIDSGSEVLITAGAMHALHCTLLALLDPGDEVLLYTPSYFFEGLITLAGGRMKTAPLPAEEGFRWDVEALSRAVSPRTRVILLNTPANPSGIVADEACLEAIGELAARHGLFVVCDESYDRMVFDGGRHVSILESRTNRDRTVLVGSFTKSFALAPWRVGYVISSPTVSRGIRKVLEWTVLFCPLVNQRLAEAVLRSDRKWVAGVDKEFEENRDRMMSALTDHPTVSVSKPAGGPFVFVDLRKLEDSDEALCARLVAEYGIPCTPGRFHGTEGFARIPFGGKPELVAEAGRRVAEAFTAFAQ